ncbi:MoaD/ThiS family protein [Chloroflexota bacterium]
MIQVKLEIVAPLARLSGDNTDFMERVNEGTTVKDLLIGLCTKHTNFADVVFCTGSDKLSGQVDILINGRYLDLQDGLSTILANGDIVSLLPVFEGG